MENKLCKLQLPLFFHNRKDQENDGDDKAYACYSSRFALLAD